jgi:hypothetical protein
MSAFERTPAPPKRQPLVRNQHQDKKAGGQQFQRVTTSLEIHPVRHCAIDQHADTGRIA